MIFTDADNTLWDTNAIYAKAQLALLEDVEASMAKAAPDAGRLQFVRAIDQELARTHHSGLRYPPEFLAIALALALDGSSPRDAARQAWRESRPEGLAKLNATALARQFVARLNTPPPLRAGVKFGLEQLSRSGQEVAIVTEGHRQKCISLLSLHDIGQYIKKVLEAPKRPEFFSRLRRIKQDGVVRLMIGDQLDRDIRPAKEAGLVTVYFPGGFQPKWTPTVEDVRPDYIISSFDQILEIITHLELEVSHERSATAR